MQPFYSRHGCQYFSLSLSAVTGVNDFCVTVSVHSYPRQTTYTHGRTHIPSPLSSIYVCVTCHKVWWARGNLVERFTVPPREPRMDDASLGTFSNDLVWALQLRRGWMVHEHTVFLAMMISQTPDSGSHRHHKKMDDLISLLFRTLKWANMLLEQMSLHPHCCLQQYWIQEPT